MTKLAPYPETTYAVLGLVDKVPATSGYDLSALTEHSLAYFWPISRTLLYRELNRLTELAWVRATSVTQTQAPNKRTYVTTPEGQRALARWLASPAPFASGERNPVLLRLFFSHRLTDDQVAALLARYRADLQSQRDQFVRIRDKLQTVASPQARAGRLAAARLTHRRSATAMDRGGRTAARRGLQMSNCVLTGT